MATKVIYVNPGDLVDIRIIVDPEVEKTATEWKYQIRPEHILMQVKCYQRIALADPAIYVDRHFDSK